MISEQLVNITNSDGLKKGGQLYIEGEFQKYFRISSPATITDEFQQIKGSADNQIMYLNIALKVIEELDVEPVQAFGLLEAIRPVIYEKFKILTSRFVGKSLVTKSRANELVFSALDLYARLTATYDSVIEEAKYFGESQIFIMGSAIHRALADKSKLVLCYLQLYMDIPDELWKHMSRLYLTADQYNIHNQIIPDEMIFPEHQLSIKHIYIYTHALMSCGAGSLNIDEILTISELLKAQVKTIKTSNIKPKFNSLCIDPETMLKTCFVSELKHAPSDTMIYFDFSSLEKTFKKQHMTQIFINLKRHILSSETLRKIYDNWTVPRPMAADRKAGSGTLITRPGLALNWATQKTLPPPAQNNDLIERSFRGRNLNLNFSYSELDFCELKPINDYSAGCHMPEVVDFSRSGYRLQWNVSIAPLLSVGELVVVNDPIHNEQRLCQVVWIKSAENNTLRTGVSVLSSCIMPVLIQAVKKTPSENQKEAIEGFLLCSQGREERGTKNSYSIVVATEQLNMGNVVTMTQDDALYHAQILELSGSNDLYQTFNVGFYDAVGE